MPDLFAYGTLLDERVQRAVFGRGVAGRPDHLAGHTRTVTRVGAGRYPNVAHTGRPTDLVAGAVLALSEDELRAADAYETAAYERRVVTLASGTAAWVYVAGTPGALAVAPSGHAEKP